MRCSWSWFGLNPKVYATATEQKLISEGTNLPAKPIYTGDEARVVLEWSKQQLRKGKANYTSGSDKIP
jgi:hypothetical protein